MPKVFRGFLVVLSLASISPALAREPSVRYYPRANKPFSTAVRIGDLVYISGVTGTASDGSMPTDFTVQATNAMEAVATQLKVAGAAMSDVYKCNVALTDMNDWAAFNAVYVKYFKPDRFPVRMAIGVTSLGGSAVEVQCEAYVSRPAAR